MGNYSDDIEQVFLERVHNIIDGKINKTYFNIQGRRVCELIFHQFTRIPAESLTKQFTNAS